MLQCIQRRRRRFQITRQHVVQNRVIGGSLNIGFAAQRVDAAARDPHVAQQKLDDRHGADVLASDGMVRPTQGVAFRSRPVRNTGGCVDFINLEEVFLRHAGNAGNLVQGVARIVLFEQLVDAPGMVEAHVPLGDAATVHVKCPRIFAVLTLGRVITGEEAVMEAEIGIHNE